MKIFSKNLARGRIKKLDEILAESKISIADEKEEMPALSRDALSADPSSILRFSLLRRRACLTSTGVCGLWLITLMLILVIVGQSTTAVGNYLLYAAVTR